MNESMIAVLVMAGVGWVAIWNSPRVLGWIAAKLMARRDSPREQRMAFLWHLARFDQEV